MNIFTIWRQLPPVTKNLLIINLLIYAALNLLGDRFNSTMINHCALHYFASQDFLPSQLFTYMFMHQGFSHLFFNMFALFMFGGIIERTLSSKRFLFYYISCGLGAALIQLGVYYLMFSYYEGLINNPFDVEKVLSDGTSLLHQGLVYNDPTLSSLQLLINTPTLGASGAIYGILLAFGFLYPRQPIYLMFIPIPIQARWMVLGYGIIELTQALNMNPNDNVAHLAHLGGMLFGFIMLLYWKRKGLFNNQPF